MTYTKRKRYSKRDALRGGPGLEAFAFRAEVYCVDCAHEIIEALPESGWDLVDFFDMQRVPQPIFFDEEETSVRCAKCSAYLNRPKENGNGQHQS